MTNTEQEALREEHNLLPWEPLIRGTFGIISDHTAEAGDKCEHCGKMLEAGSLMFSAYTSPFFCSWDCAVAYPFNKVIDRRAY